MHDRVIPFTFESLPVRGAIVQLAESWQDLIGAHEYAASVRGVLGEAAAATTLFAQTLKAGSTVTLQITGDGPLSMLVMQCTSELEYRGLATAPGDADDLSYAALVAGGRCAITVDNRESERPYQGIVEVGGASLADNLEHYYARSAQIPSRLSLVAASARGGGILLQQMPGAHALSEDDWRRLGYLAATLRVEDLREGLDAAVIGRFFPEDDVRVFAPKDASFRCRCSRERVVNTLKLLGKDECQSVLEDEGELVITCEYCGRVRRFDAVDLAAVFADPVVATRPDSLH